ncbi:MAG: FkbM family methyltransferase [Patescibacteria group bacterium]
MKKILKKLFFGKKAFQIIFRRLFDVSIEGMNIGTGGRHPNENGELFAARYALSKEQTHVIFDVGAQGGDYIKEIFNLTKGKAKIYAFEPCLRDYEILKKELGDNAIIVKSALGDTDGEAILYRPDNISGLSTLHKPHGGFVGSEKVKIQTIDNFCKLNDIKNITLLKLDVEGNELACLKGAKQMLPNIKYIQFEFSASSRDSRTYFRDIFNFLSDYKIYRVLRDGLYEIKSPEKITELLFTTNYLAERMNT